MRNLYYTVVFLGMLLGEASPAHAEIEVRRGDEIEFTVVDTVRFGMDTKTSDLLKNTPGQECNIFLTAKQPERFSRIIANGTTFTARVDSVLNEEDEAGSPGVGWTNLTAKINNAGSDLNYLFVSGENLTFTLTQLISEFEKCPSLKFIKLNPDGHLKDTIIK